MKETLNDQPDADGTILETRRKRLGVGYTAVDILEYEAVREFIGQQNAAIEERRWEVQARIARRPFARIVPN